MLFAPELVVVAETVVVAPVSSPDMAAAISIDFIVALVIAVIPFRQIVRVVRLASAAGRNFLVTPM
jgi:hypothetical protein